MRISFWSPPDIQRIRLSLVQQEEIRDNNFEELNDEDYGRLSKESIVTEEELKRLRLSLLCNSYSQSLLCANNPRNSESRKKNTFPVEKQSRPGAHHGLGGRSQGMTAAELQDPFQLKSKVNLSDIYSSSVKEILTSSVRD